MVDLNPTHDPRLKSWVDAANEPECDFPIQNLPYGVFSTPAQPTPRVGLAIGDQVLDLAVLEEQGLVAPAAGLKVFNRLKLNDFMALGSAVWSRTRSQLSGLMRSDNPLLRDNFALRSAALTPIRAAKLYRPAEFKGYTDFYSSKQHATNVGKMFRDPARPLLPNWVHMPIAYNGRTSTVVVSGTPVRRPLGQIKLLNSDLPILAASRKLDFELEMGAIVGRNSSIGETLSIEQAHDMIFGYVLLNDWSARDIQQWENIPLGPFQAKAFATSISPWIVTAEALAPFRVSGPQQDPPPLNYLRAQAAYHYDIELEVALEPAGSSQATTICRTNFKTMYWSSVQQLVHHATCGCAMEVGDLLGSGTISGPDSGSFGSLLELTWNGEHPLPLPDRGVRTFIEDGDEIIMTGWGWQGNYRVGFGTVRGKILPAWPL
jgi:fumarylacetoacetase